MPPKWKPFGAVAETMLVRMDESGMIAIERLGAANMPFLLEHGPCLDAASRVLVHVEFVGTAGVERQVNQAVTV
jgi:hypothetical protein